jgi:RHS repeat-associated protein
MNGAVVWSAKYSSFGEANVDPSSTITNNLRFPGQYYDEETGLRYNWWRYLDAESGRYLRQEPLKDLLIPGNSFILRDLILCGEWDVNLYRYCLNDPINLIDPYGLKSAVPWVLIARVVCTTVCFGKAMNCHKNCATEDEGDCPDPEAKKKCKVKCNIGYVNCMDTCWPDWFEYSPKPERPDTPGSGGGGAGGPFDGPGGFGGGESGGGGGFRSF